MRDDHQSRSIALVRVDTQMSAALGRHVHFCRRVEVPVARSKDQCVQNPVPFARRAMSIQLDSPASRHWLALCDRS
jgi:hypothetical protein